MLALLGAISFLKQQATDVVLHAFLALTGTADETARVAQAFRVYFKKIDQGGNAGYTMDHAATVFLLDSR